MNRRTIAILAFVAASLIVVVAIIVGTPVEAPAPPATPDGAAPTLDGRPKTQSAQQVLARLTVVDLNDTPLSGMVPIATKTPNAFRQPEATGVPSDASGRATLRLPGDTYLYVRAWDPKLHYFATNYFDVPPAPDGGETEPMRVVMAEAATLSGIVVDGAGNPLQDYVVDIMLVHPEKGDWWPARSRADGDGYVEFASVPPGRFGLRVSVGDAGNAKIEEIVLRHGGTADFGVLQLVR